MGSTPGTDAAAHPHGSLENVEVAHETSDINIRAVVWFVIILVVAAVAINASMWALFVVLDRIDAKNDPTLSPLMAPAGQLPPEPRLQIIPWEDLKKFRGNEDLYLHSYGWVDKSAGVAHLPIDKAKALLLQRGLPTRPGPVDPTEGTHVAASGESSGGRNIPAGTPAAPAQLAAPGSIRSTGTAKGTWRRPVRARPGAVRVHRSVLVLGAPSGARAQGMGMPEPPLDAASKKPLILQKVGIDQKIGQQLPLDLEFVDEHGREVRLGDYFGARPVVLGAGLLRVPDALHASSQRHDRRAEDAVVRRRQGLRRRRRQHQPARRPAAGRREEGELHRALRTARDRRTAGTS